LELSSITRDNYTEVVRIYEEGIATGIATFETSAPSWEAWDQAHHSFGRIIVKKDSDYLGWGALSPTSKRHVYRGVAEVSIYVAADSRGKGIGTLLLQSLIKESEENGIWTLQSGIFRDNLSSIAMHEQCGFRVIGYKERIGNLNGVWLDNILMERRSGKVGM